MNEISLSQVSLNNKIYFSDDIFSVIASHVPAEKIEGCRIRFRQFAGCENYNKKNESYSEHRSKCNKCKNYTKNTRIFIINEYGSNILFTEYINYIKKKLLEDKDSLIKTYFNDRIKKGISYIEKINDKKYILHGVKFALFISFFNKLNPKKSYKITYDSTIPSTSLNIVYDIDDKIVRSKLRCVSKIFNQFVIK